MKKILMLLLATLLLLGLCACGGAENEGEEAQEQMQITVKPKQDKTEDETTTPEEETGEATIPEDTSETTEPEQTTGKSKRELAVSCIDKDVSELYALIGQPLSADYAPSCLVDGEDGLLEYDGFVVYTIRENGKETVYDVE